MSVDTVTTAHVVPKRGQASGVNCTPMISVALCNYNHGKYIGNCLAGILRQTYKNFEIVVTDDGSTDNSRRIIRDFAAADSRVVVNFLPKNGGLMAAVEKTMKSVRGTYIYNEASDDFLVDEFFFERAMKALEQHPSAAGFFAATALLSEEKQQVYQTIGSSPKQGFLSPDEFFPAFLRGQVFVPGSSSLWRRDLFEGIGGFDYRLGPQIDYLINHLLPSIHGVVFENVVAKVMRTFETSISYSSGSTIWAQAERHALVEKILRERVKGYEGMEPDWNLWRARIMVDAINRSGVKLN